MDFVFYVFLAAVSAAQFGLGFENLGIGFGIFFGFIALASLLKEHRKA
jgi:apolipoprotein N-acyltransferase